MYVWLDALTNTLRDWLSRERELWKRYWPRKSICRKDVVRFPRRLLAAS